MKLRTYALVTGAYWAFTVTDGALRMLVLLHFHQLGYSPVALGFLFLLYEFLGIVTNHVGGRLGSRFGLNRTLLAGLATQVVALGLMSLQDPGWAEVVSVAFVMGAQALAGVAKDLTKMSSKSAIKVLVPETGAGAGADGPQLFRWVAILTGSKNALKGVGFFVGGVLLDRLGYVDALRSMAAVLLLVLVAVAVGFRNDIGRASRPKPMGSVLSESAAVNRLAAARVFLFGARDVWFVVALPVFLDSELNWSFEAIGGFLALWVIGYGVVQSLVPALLGSQQTVQMARRWAAILAVVTAVLAVAVSAGVSPTLVVLGGLAGFGVVFAINSAVHSYLILAYVEGDDVATEVGFYYSANAVGRLVGTLLSGLTFLLGGLETSLWVSASFLGIAWLLSRRLPELPVPQPTHLAAAQRAPPLEC